MFDETPPLAESLATAGAAGPADASVLLAPAHEARRRRARRLALRLPTSLGTRAGALALAAIVLGACAVVVVSTAGPSGLVARSGAIFPAWEAGPLHGLFGRPTPSANALTVAYSLLLVAMTLAYAVSILAARSLSMRAIAFAVVAVAVLLTFSPPLQLTDTFNYLGYARLGALHGLNPYTHVISAENWDPVYRASTWHNLSSPYGPLFTALSYLIVWLPLPAAYWALKLLMVAASLGFVWVLAWCAWLLGRDPRVVVAFVALNPLYVFYAIGGFHNDFLMLLPSTAAVGLVLSRRDRAAGAALMVAVAIKLTAVILLPFLLVAAGAGLRRRRVLEGGALAALPLAAMSLALFGLHIPNLGTQSGVVTGFSIPNLTGLALGLGGVSAGVLLIADLIVVATIVYWLRRPREWVAGAGWSTMALVMSVPWLMPWYLIWVLPLAALGTSRALRRFSLAFTVFLVLTFIPETSEFVNRHGLNPMSTRQGQAALAAQAKLQK